MGQSCQKVKERKHGSSEPTTDHNTTRSRASPTRTPIPASSSSSSPPSAARAPAATATKSSPTHDPNVRHGACKYFLAGYCKFGTSCQYKHPGVDNSAGGKDKKVGEPCRYFMSGHCRDGADCKYLHYEGLQDTSDFHSGGGSGGGGGGGRRSGHHHHGDDHEDAALQRALQESMKDRHAAGSRTDPEPIRAGAHGDIVETFPILQYTAKMKESAGDAEDRTMCPICFVNYDEGEQIMVLPCMHWFHPKCVKDWLANHDECPLCQTNVRKEVDHFREGDGVGDENVPAYGVFDPSVTHNSGRGRGGGGAVRGRDGQHVGRQLPAPL